MAVKIQLTTEDLIDLAKEQLIKQGLSKELVDKLKFSSENVSVTGSLGAELPEVTTKEPGTQPKKRGRKPKASLEDKVQVIEENNEDDESKPFNYHCKLVAPKIPTGTGDTATITKENYAYLMNKMYTNADGLNVDERIAAFCFEAHHPDDATYALFGDNPPEQGALASDPTARVDTPMTLQEARYYKYFTIQQRKQDRHVNLNPYGYTYVDEANHINAHKGRHIKIIHRDGHIFYYVKLPNEPLMKEYRAEDPKPDEHGKYPIDYLREMEANGGQLPASLAKYNFK